MQKTFASVECFDLLHAFDDHIHIMETLVVARTDRYPGYSPTALPSLTRTWPTTPRGLRLHIVLSRFQATATTPSSMSADHENAF